MHIACLYHIVIRYAFYMLNKMWCGKHFFRKISPSSLSCLRFKRYLLTNRTNALLICNIMKFLATKTSHLFKPLNNCRTHQLDLLKELSKLDNKSRYYKP